MTMDEPILVDSPVRKRSRPRLVAATEVIDLTDDASPERRVPPTATVHNPYQMTTKATINPYQTSTTKKRTIYPFPMTQMTKANKTTMGPASLPKVLPPPPATTSSSFIGGAEAARRLAQKKTKTPNAATRILRPGEAMQQKQKNNAVLPKYMNIMERFFAALFRSSPEEYRTSASSTSSSTTELWERICQRVDVTIPTEPLLNQYHDMNAHCQGRVALLLEECRCAVAQALVQSERSPQQKQTNALPSFASEMAVQKVEAASSNHSYSKKRTNSQQQQQHAKVTFHKTTPGSFSFAELNVIRPGAVFLCTTSGNNGSESLGVVVTGNRDYVESHASFAMLLFSEDDPILLPHVHVTLTYLTQLVTQFRCFEALTTNYPVAFLRPLLGLGGDAQPTPQPTHIRFNKPSRVSLSFDDDSEDDDDEAFYDASPRMVSSSSGSSSKEEENVDTNGISEHFHVPLLNATQNQAAQTFLHAPPGTITLVQGPPGTGKTTLLVAILCRYCSSMAAGATKKRILVAAPTNKAVAVLATRFLKSLQANAPIQVLLVGDADKLLAEEGPRRRKEAPSKKDAALKSIFLYTWMPSIIEGYTRILAATNRREVLPLAKQLREQVTRRLSRLPEPFVKRMDEIVALLERSSSSTAALIKLTQEHIQELKGMSLDMVWEQLLQSAQVIFCTLASAGGTVMKKTNRIDDLIVDEAAAATEPELYIPLYLQPSRLLVVGDPLQLPATVLSRRALELGLAKSLHERLMYDCKYEHIMLNVQYRMHANISAFPSARFYENKIGNGSNVTSPEYGNGALLLNRQPYTFLQVDGREEQWMGGSYQNRMEAEMIVELILTLRQLTGRSDAWCGPDRIRVITFYQAQVTCIERCLADRGLGNTVVVATVDSSQGCEADIVLISFVRSRRQDDFGAAEMSSEGRCSSAGFLNDDRRMNVALTRAKYQLICVGNVRNFHQIPNAPTLHCLAKDAEERGVIRLAPPAGMEQAEIPTIHPAFKKFCRSWNNA